MPSRQVGLSGTRAVRPGELEQLLGQPTPEEVLESELERRRQEFWGGFKTKAHEEKAMTVGLYRSTASGSNEIVVQTNAHSLDVFTAGLAEAMVGIAEKGGDLASMEAIFAGTLKNAFPIAFSIAGYKAERVNEAKVLTCGAAAPDPRHLVSQSRV